MRASRTTTGKALLNTARLPSTNAWSGVASVLAITILGVGQAPATATSSHPQQPTAQAKSPHHSMPVRCPFMRYTPIRHIPREIYAYETHAHERDTREMLACGVHIHQTYLHGMHAREIHVR